jgi:hypothetical protein
MPLKDEMEVTPATPSLIPAHVPLVAVETGMIYDLKGGRTGLPCANAVNGLAFVPNNGCKPRRSSVLCWLPALICCAFLSSTV